MSNLPIKSCTVCGIETQYACADCTINSGGLVRPHVCTDPACRDKHEAGVHGKALPMTAPLSENTDLGSK